mmetsp:Transcript_101386/g.295378  ORF Transcript_101386/g.295378 Transcript_101386/m.295378 type:complete len:291 (+) Transcript_101386:347-1219(+)
MSPSSPCPSFLKMASLTRSRVVDFGTTTTKVSLVWSCLTCTSTQSSSSPQGKCRSNSTSDKASRMPGSFACTLASDSKLRKPSAPSPAKAARGSSRPSSCAELCSWPKSCRSACRSSCASSSEGAGNLERCHGDCLEPQLAVASCSASPIKNSVSSAMEMNSGPSAAFIATAGRTGPTELLLCTATLHAGISRKGTATGSAPRSHIMPSDSQSPMTSGEDSSVGVSSHWPCCMSLPIPRPCRAASTTRFCHVVATSGTTTTSMLQAWREAPTARSTPSRRSSRWLPRGSR